MNRSYASALVKLIAGIYPSAEAAGPRRPFGRCCFVGFRRSPDTSWVADSAASPEHKQVLARVDDLTVRPVVRLEEVDPVAVQLLAAVTE